MKQKILLENINGYSLAPDYNALFTSSETAKDIFKVNFTATDRRKHTFSFYPTNVGGRGKVSLRPQLIGILQNGLEMHNR